MIEFLLVVIMIIMVLTMIPAILVGYAILAVLVIAGGLLASPFILLAIAALIG